MHDKNGKHLAEGDKVTITCTVKQLTQYAPEYCNILLETVEPMYPTDQPTSISLNTKQVEKIE